MNPQAPLVSSRLGGKDISEAPPPEEILQREFKEVEGSSHSLGQQSFLEPAEAQEPFRGGFRSCRGRIDQIWAKVSQGKPILWCSLLLPTPTLGVQLCNGHWEVTTCLRSFDPRKKKKCKKILPSKVRRIFTGIAFFHLLCAREKQGYQNEIWQCRCINWLSVVFCK